MSRSAQKVMFPTCTPMDGYGWVWGQVPNDFLIRNCMNFADLDRKIMFLISHLSWGVRWGFRESFDKKCFARNSKISKFAQKSCFQPHTCIGWGGVEVVNFLVEKIVNRHPLPWGWRVDKHDLLQSFGHFNTFYQNLFIV